MEMSCDERALKEIGGETKRDYLLALLSLATEKRSFGGIPLAFGEGGIKERVKNVLNFRKHSWIVIIAAVALATAVSIGFIVNRAGVTQNTSGNVHKDFAIANWVSAIGAADENDLNNTDQQRYSYTLYLTSETGKLDDVKKVMAIVADNVSSRVITNEIPSLNVNNDYIEIQGSIIFNAKGFTKEQIVQGLNPFITAAKLTSKDNTEYTVELNPVDEVKSSAAIATEAPMSPPIYGKMGGQRPMTLDDVRSIAKNIGTSLTINDLYGFIGTDTGQMLNSHNEVTFTVDNGVYLLSVGYMDSLIWNADFGRVIDGKMQHYYKIALYAPSHFRRNFTNCA